MISGFLGLLKASEPSRFRFSFFLGARVKSLRAVGQTLRGRLNCLSKPAGSARYQRSASRAEFGFRCLPFPDEIYGFLNCNSSASRRRKLAAPFPATAPDFRHLLFLKTSEPSRFRYRQRTGTLWIIAIPRRDAQQATGQNFWHSRDCFATARKVRSAQNWRAEVIFTFLTDF